MQMLSFLMGHHGYDSGVIATFTILLCCYIVFFIILMFPGILFSMARASELVQVLLKNFIKHEQAPAELGRNTAGWFCKYSWNNQALAQKVPQSLKFPGKILRFQKKSYLKMEIINFLLVSLFVVLGAHDSEIVSKIAKENQIPMKFVNTPLVLGLVANLCVL